MRRSTTPRPPSGDREESATSADRPPRGPPAPRSAGPPEQHDVPPGLRRQPATLDRCPLPTATSESMSSESSPSALARTSLHLGTASLTSALPPTSLATGQCVDRRATEAPPTLRRLASAPAAPRCPPPDRPPPTAPSSELPPSETSTRARCPRSRHRRRGSCPGRRPRPPRPGTTSPLPLSSTSTTSVSTTSPGAAPYARRARCEQGAVNARMTCG
jgi:hypothetical protein